jgi:outer membrane protein assembly factor BamE
MIRNLIRSFTSAAAPAIIALVAGCDSVPRIPYKIEIQQGNFISQDMVSRLKPGMSKEQVRSVLGTPLLTGIFHAERWDYVYWREQSDGKRESRKLVVFFDGGKLARVGGDMVSPEDPK